MKTLLRAFALLPLPVLHALGSAMGWLAYWFSGTYRRRFNENAQLAGLSAAKLGGAIGEAGKLVAETPRLWFGKPVPMQWMDVDVVRAAVAKGRGVLFLTPHLGCFEITAQAYAAIFGPITVLYRPARKPWLRDLVATSRVRKNLVVAPTTLGGVKQLLQALRAGQVVGLLPDQVPPGGMGVWAPFFGQPAYTMTLPSRLVKQTGATVLLVWGERLAHGQGFRVHVRSWDGEFEADPVAAATQVNTAMEALIREHPAQYLWGYARYKQPRRETPA